MATGFVRRDKGRYAFALGALYQSGVAGQIVLNSTAAVVQGSTGTAANQCKPGSLLVDYNNAFYVNTGTSAIPTWSSVATAVAANSTTAQGIAVTSSTPASGSTSATAAGSVLPGSLLTDITHAVEYINIGTSTTPVWLPQTEAIAAISVASTALPNFGVTTFNTTLGAAYTLADPVAGCIKKIVQLVTTSSSDGMNTVTVGTTNTITAVSTAGASLTKFSFRSAGGGALCLEGLSATQWLVTTINSTTTISST